MRVESRRIRLKKAKAVGNPALLPIDSKASHYRLLNRDELIKPYDVMGYIGRQRVIEAWVGVPARMANQPVFRPLMMFHDL